MYTLTKTFKVLDVIKSVQDITPKDGDIYLHMKNELLKGIGLLDLDNLLHKFEKDEKILLIKKLSSKSPRKNVNDSPEYWNLPALGKESYVLSLNNKFDSYYNKIQYEAKLN